MIQGRLASWGGVFLSTSGRATRTKPDRGTVSRTRYNKSGVGGTDENTKTEGAGETKTLPQNGGPPPLPPPLDFFSYFVLPVI